MAGPALREHGSQQTAREGQKHSQTKAKHAAGMHQMTSLARRGQFSSQGPRPTLFKKNVRLF